MRPGSTVMPPPLMTVPSGGPAPLGVTDAMVRPRTMTSRRPLEDVSAVEDPCVTDRELGGRCGDRGRHRRRLPAEENHVKPDPGLGEMSCTAPCWCWTLRPQRPTPHLV